MKILVLMKRFGANKDMVGKDFGRQVRLFENLAKIHHIDFLCPDYTKKEKKTVKRKGIRYFVVPVSLFSVFSFIRKVNEFIENEKYDIIFAASDPLLGILGNKLAKKFKIPMIYDLQDNFEAYSSCRIPFVKKMHKRAVEDSDIVLTVSEELKNYVSNGRKRPTHVIRNGIETKLFMTVDREKARKRLRLPLKSKIIVYIGDLEKLKGADVLLQSFERVKKEFPDTYLLLSGKIGKGVNVSQKNLILRKFAERKDVVLAINCADVAVIPNVSNEFTKYCFPYKLAEYMACNAPIVATDIGDVSVMLKKYNGSLAVPGNVGDFTEKVLLRLENSSRPDYKDDVKEFDWKKLSHELDKIINDIGHSK